MAAADEIAEKLAQKISLTQNPITGDRTFVRFWKPMSMTLSSDVEAALFAITSVTKPQYENGMKSEAGEWQVSSCGWEPKLGGYIQVLTIASPLDGGVVTTSEDIYEASTEQQLFNQAAAPTLGAFTVGVIKRISAAIDRTLKKWTVQISTVTSKQVISVYTFKARVNGGSETHCIVRNQQGNSPDFAAADVLAAGLPVLASGYVYDLVGSPKRNPDGTWDWYIVHREDDLAITSGTKSIYRYRDVWRTVTTDEYYNGGYPLGERRWQKALVTERTDYTVYSTAAAAWAANGGFPRKIGEGLWLVSGTSTYQHIWTWDTAKG